MKHLVCIAAVLLISLVTFAHIQKTGKFRILIHTNYIVENTRAYLLYQTNGKKIFDSTVVRNQLIEFKGEIESMLPATIVLDKSALGLKGLLKKRTDVDFLKIYLCLGLSEAVTTGQLATAVFKAPGINQDFSVLQLMLKTIDEAWGKVSRELVTATDANRIQILRQQYDSLTRERVPLLEKFILQNPKSRIALVAWEEWKGFKLRADQSVIGEIRSLYETLSAEVRNSEEALQARTFFANQSGLMPGQPAPDFVQPDPKGKSVRLSDFRGKYVLLDFWASWCGPCRASSPALVKLYDEFSKRNFTILGISLDDQQGRKNWLNAIQTDGLKWQQVSDLRHWDNAVVKRYSVAAVPFSILIDPDGKIVQLGGSVDDLRQTLVRLNL